MTKFNWIFEPSTNPQVEDDEWLMENPYSPDHRFGIQDCRAYAGGYSVNEYFYEPGQAGNLSSCKSHGTFRSRKAAMAYAEKLFADAKWVSMGDIETSTPAYWEE
jgi:hypothetical protein